MVFVNYFHDCLTFFECCLTHESSFVPNNYSIVSNKELRRTKKRPLPEEKSLLKKEKGKHFRLFDIILFLHEMGLVSKISINERNTLNESCNIHL